MSSTFLYFAKSFFCSNKFAELLKTLYEHALKMFKLVLCRCFLARPSDSYMISPPRDEKRASNLLQVYPEVYVSTKYTLNVSFYNTDFVKLFHLI